MRHSLSYLETNKCHKHQKPIAIAKEINICIIRFEVKENETVYKHSSTSQASIIAEKAAIIKQRMADCKKTYKKVLFSLYLPLISGQMI